MSLVANGFWLPTTVAVIARIALLARLVRDRTATAVA
jgi:hypothetical protein